MLLIFVFQRNGPIKSVAVFSILFAMGLKFLEIEVRSIAMVLDLDPQKMLEKGLGISVFTNPWYPDNIFFLS